MSERTAARDKRQEQHHARQARQAAAWRRAYEEAERRALAGEAVVLTLNAEGGHLRGPILARPL